MWDALAKVLTWLFLRRGPEQESLRVNYESIVVMHEKLSAAVMTRCDRYEQKITDIQAAADNCEEQRRLDHKRIDELTYKIEQLDHKRVDEMIRRIAELEAIIRERS